MNSFTDDPSVIAKECIAMLKHLSVPPWDIRGMGIQIGKLSDDNRKTSSSKTLHSFMKPIKRSPNDGVILGREQNRVENNENVNHKTLKVGEVASETHQKQALDGESSKLTSFGTSHHVDENVDEFKLVLSDDEEETSCNPQELSKTNDMPATSCNKERDSICNERSSSRQDFPPLPMFPIFSPRKTSPSNR